MMPLGNMLQEKRRRGEKILSIYLTAGYPSPEATLPLLETIAGAGADLIELGIPFSDPIADGPGIQAASQQALAAGTTLNLALDLLEKFKSRNALPVLLMGYSNPFFRFGWAKLIGRTATAGASGFIVPDLPPEESVSIAESITGAGMDLIFLASPNTPPGRIKLINERTTAFIYAVSLTGVTGERDRLPEETETFLKNLRRQTTHPLLCGFGISNAATARTVSRFSDGVIIGSAVINRIAAAQDLSGACRSVQQFVGEMKGTLRK